MASMRVLGMTVREVFSVITFEQWFLSFFGILAGLPLAQLLSHIMAAYFSTDMYTMPARISNDSLLVGAILTVVSIWVAQRFAVKRVRKLDLVGVLKSGE